MECVLQDLVTENADLQSKNLTKDRELADAQQQLREKVGFNLSRHWKSTVLSDLQEAQVTNVTQMHSRLQQQLKEKVKVEKISCAQTTCVFIFLIQDHTQGGLRG